MSRTDHERVDRQTTKRRTPSRCLCFHLRTSSSQADNAHVREVTIGSVYSSCFRTLVSSLPLSSYEDISSYEDTFGTSQFMVFFAA